MSATPQLHASMTVLWSAVSSVATEANMLRLDAGAYCNASRQWDVTMARQENLCRLDSLGTVHQPIIFGKRAMAGSEQKGIPVYSSSEMLMTHPEPAFYLSRRFEKRISHSLAVKQGWVLISRAGSIGYIFYVPRERDGWIVDDHMIRVIPSDPEIGALLYTYLSGPLGQTALHAMAYGAVQLVIKDIQIASMQIPVPNRAIIDAIEARVAKASDARSLAVSLAAEAQRRLHATTDLTPLERVCQSATGDLSADCECFQVNAALLYSQNSNGSEHRLDAHFYNPTAQQAVASIRKCREVKTVGEVAQVIFTGGRIKRNYVESDHGVPFLSGKNIVQIRPTDLKYLSNLQMAEMPELLLKQSSTLITRSGTIGRTCFVWKNYEDYAGSEHILRVIPDDSKIDPGYLYAFLSSQYGYEQILRYRHGSVIDEVTDKQIEQVLVPLPSRREQTAIGDKVREAYDKRAEAIRLEDEAQAILMKELTKAPEAKGV